MAKKILLLFNNIARCVWGGGVTRIYSVYSLINCEQSHQSMKDVFSSNTFFWMQQKIKIICLNVYGVHSTEEGWWSKGKNVFQNVANYYRIKNVCIIYIKIIKEKQVKCDDEALGNLIIIFLFLMSRFLQNKKKL